MAPATEKSQLDMILEMKDFKTKMDTVNTLFQTSINNATKLGQVVDAIATKVDNLAAVAANANSTVNKTFNNANTYTTNQNITRVTAGGKNKQTIKINDQVVSVDKTDQSALAKNARAEAIEALKKQNDLLDQQIEKAKKLVDVEQKRAELIGEKAKNYSRDSESKSKNAEANLLNAQTRSKYPWLFGSGANNRSFKYQGGKMLQNLGGVASGFGTGGKLVGYGLDTAGALLKSPAMGASAALSNLGKAISDLGKEAVKSFSEIESIKTQLGVVFSNQTQANSMFGEISQYAVKSPFGVQQTSELAVLLKQSGVYASDLMDTLKMLGDTAGGNMEKMKRIANNYAQIVSIGKASMLDMRQFAYAGIPIFEAVSKELGVSQQELRKLISDGKVTADIIEKVFKDLTGINGIFENATAKGAKTLKARLQNLQDAKQLAFASGGEWLTKLGTESGNDSYTNEIVSWLEKIYQNINDTIDTRNIEKSVKAIEERENRIAVLQGLIDKYADNPRMAAIFAQALGVELEKRSREQDRATYESSYQSKTKLAENTYKQWGVSNFDELRKLAEIINLDSRKQYQGGKNSLTGGGVLHSANYADSLEFATSKGYDLKELYNLPDSDFKALAESLDDAVKAVNSLKAVTDTEIQYHHESMLLQAQQLAFDQENSRAGKTDSLNTSFQELLELEKSTDEYQQKQEEEHKEILKSAQTELKKLVAKADKTGNLDISKFSLADFTKYNSLGAFNSGRKLTVVNGDGIPNHEDVTLLKKQFGHFMDEGLKALGVTERYDEASGKNVKVANGPYTQTANALIKEMSTLNGNLSDTAYLDKFAGVMNNIEKILSGAELPDAVRQSIYDSIVASTYSHELTVGGENVDVDAALSKKKGTSQEFIPLWKRILSQYTGLTTNGMTDTKSTMENYRDDMAIRNMAQNVLPTVIKSASVEAAMSLVKTNKAVQLSGDSGKTFQVDWLETKKAMHNFAMQLSASTDVISAYKQSLEEELETYEQLVTAGYSQAESADLGSQKYVSSKQLEKLGLGNESQLVNAFGEVVKTASGLTYSVKEIQFINGELYTLEGKKIDEQIEITGNLFEFIKDQLPKLREEIYEASMREKGNEILKKMWDEASSTSFLNTLLGTQGVNNSTGYLVTNPNYLTEGVVEYLDTHKGEILEKGKWNVETGKNDPDKYKYESIKDSKATDILIKNEIAKIRIPELQKERDALEKERAELISKRELYSSAGGPRMDEGSMSRLETKIENLTTTLQSLTEEESELKNVQGFVAEAFNNVSESAEKETSGAAYKDLKVLLANKKRDNALNNDILGMYGIPAEEITPDKYEGARGVRNKVLKILGNEDAYDLEDWYQKVAEQVAQILASDLSDLDKVKAADELGYKVGTVETDEYGDQFVSWRTGKNNAGEDISVTDMGAEELRKNMSLADKFWESWKKGAKEGKQVITDLGNELGATVAEFGKGSFVKPFEKMAENLVIGKEATDGMEDVYKNLTAELLTASGAAMQKAGWELVARGAADDNYAMMAAGLGLAATGGVASGLGAGLTAKSDKDKKKDSELEKLNKLRNNLADLLKQAREDAIYYENNLRHQKAISANDSFTRSVHDAIISPGGDIITTDPKDYLIATKKPQTLIGGGAPTINFSVIDKSTGVRVTKQSSTYNAETNSIDFEAVIESKIVEVIASSKGDDAFAARDARLRGRTVIA